MKTRHKDICCKKLFKLLNDPLIDITYCDVTRGFILYNCGIENCPMCGKKFPVELAKFCDEIQEKEFGITRANYYNFERKNLIPKEFFTDEWWLKREHYPNFPTKRLTHKEYLKKSIYDSDFISEKEKADRYEQYLKEEYFLKKKLGIFCCTGLWNNVFDAVDCKDHQNTECSESMILYEPEKRRFQFKNMPNTDQVCYKKYQKKILLRIQIQYCFRCGKELPKSLASLWFKIVTTEFGVTDIFNQKQLVKKLPPEFLTEQWWQQRGL